ncbi:MAG: sulfotransferase [Rhizobiaceae bacterium]
MRLIHPLAGSRFATAMRLLAAHGGVAPAATPAVAVMAASHGLRYLSCELEIRRARRRAVGAAPMPDPVFVLGHWRSGTTLFANLMSFDEDFFFPTLVEAVSPHDFFPSPLERLSRRWLPLLFPETRPMDGVRVPLRRNSPQEDEMALAALGQPSFFNALYFPSCAQETIAREVFFDGLTAGEVARWCEVQHGFIRKLALLNPGRTPLVKNPAHAARLGPLHETYPNARFILLKRNRADVITSMRRLFERLWPMLALQRHDPRTIPGLVDETHERMRQRIERDWPLLPADSRIEVRFDDLVSDPLATVCDVQQRLHRPVTETHAGAIARYMAENSPVTDRAA